jgi:hypothetical protein
MTHVLHREIDHNHLAAVSVKGIHSRYAAGTDYIGASPSLRLCSRSLGGNGSWAARSLGARRNLHALISGGAIGSAELPAVACATTTIDVGAQPAAGLGDLRQILGT